MVGFENYVFSKGIIYDLKDYFANSNSAYTDYSPICSRIKGEIRQDQIDGGMVGIYNPSITQRLNSLVDRQDIKSDDKPLNNKLEIEIVRDENPSD